jgi:dUTP pyrophosphatase
MVSVQVQRLAPDLPLPSYSHKGDAGLDFHASETITIQPDASATVKTGIIMAIPEGYAGLIWDRSGLAAKQNIHTLAGVVDSTYRGEIQVVLKNLGLKSITITKGMRIAQMLIQPVASATIQESELLATTARGKGGFGSTGL